MKYNLCQDLEGKTYFIECVKNDVYTYHRTDRAPRVIHVYEIFKILELLGEPGFEQNTNSDCCKSKVMDYKILFSFNTLKELEKEIIEYII